ncbi:hypothetical protein ONZ45_g8181 [Pleurotus djamor]|nr:hypothetical protein ONZ45_g8181 [Pleurotus djamor]
MSNSVLKALRKAHAAAPLKSPVAVVVGGTAGIGAALAVKIAQYSSAPNIHIVGRSQSSADQVISQMKELNPKGDYRFHECDASLLSNTRSLATSLSNTLHKINFLVVSQGLLTMQGRTETTEGVDIKMALHYYSRMFFIQTLLPNLLKAAEEGEDARVMTVLDSVRGDLKKLNFDDLDLKKKYTLSAVASHCISMTDVAVHHAYPAFVKTSGARNLPWYLSGPANLLASVAGVTPDECAEQLFEGFVQDSMKAGAHFVNSDGKEVKGKENVSEEVQDKVNETSTPALVPANRILLYKKLLWVSQAALPPLPPPLGIIVQNTEKTNQVDALENAGSGETQEEVDERQPCDPSYASKRLKDWSPPSKGELVREGHGDRHMPSKGIVTARIEFEFEQLLSELDEWGELRTRISETYIRLGSHFNKAIEAFGLSDSETSELHTVPEELRAVLETCLATDAVPEDVVERHRSTLSDMRDQLLEALQKRRKEQPEDEDDRVFRACSFGHGNGGAQRPFGFRKATPKTTTLIEVVDGSATSGAGDLGGKDQGVSEPGLDDITQRSDRNEGVDHTKPLEILRRGVADGPPRHCDPSYAMQKLKEWSPPNKNELRKDDNKKSRRRALPARHMNFQIRVEYEMLLHELEQWSVTRARISEIFVALGKHCNEAAASFECADDDTSEFRSAPKDLREVLESCLAKDAVPEDVELHLATVDDIKERLFEGMQKRLEKHLSPQDLQKVVEQNDDAAWLARNPAELSERNGLTVHLVKGEPRPRPRP